MLMSVDLDAGIPAIQDAGTDALAHVLQKVQVRLALEFKKSRVFQYFGVRCSELKRYRGN